MTKSVVCENMTKVFGDVIAVDDFSLEVEQGEFIVLLGASGSGKTTLLRLIAGLETATHGNLYINDKLVNNWSAKERNIAMVFQDYALYPYKTVYNNMAFPLQMGRVSKGEIKERVLQTAAMLGIHDLLDRKPAQLSGGQRQRVAVGRAMVREPSVFLMDEPLSNLDAKLRVEMRAELLSLHKRLETTFIYVTHDQIEAMTMGQRIVVMENGKIEQVGTPTEVYRTPQNLTVAQFVGVPPMNIFDVRVSHSRNIMNVMDYPLPVPIQILSVIEDKDSEIKLGIRAENLKIRLLENSPDPSIRGQVLFREALGHEDIIYVDVEGQHVAVRSSPDKEFPPGSLVSLGFQLEHILFFKENGDVILPLVE